MICLHSLALMFTELQHRVVNIGINLQIPGYIYFRLIPLSVHASLTFVVPLAGSMKE